MPPQAFSISERNVRARISKVLKSSLCKTRFVPSQATMGLKRWLLSLELTPVERRVVASAAREILLDFERRARWIGNELEQDVFKRYGGK